MTALPPPAAEDRHPTKVTSIWAYIATNDKGDEGVFAVPMPDGSKVPLVAADIARLDAIRPVAEALIEQVRTAGLPVTVELSEFRRVEGSLDWEGAR